MKILALDLGKYKTVGCAYESESGAHQFQRTFTAPADLQRLVQEVNPMQLLRTIPGVGPRLAEASLLYCRLGV
jgi:hypothetical protein